MKIQIRLGRGRAALSLVLGAQRAGAIWVFCGAGHPEKCQLAHLHAWIQRDWQVSRVGKLEGDVALEAWVDETCGGVSNQTEAAERRFTFQTTR